jgi:hypothetical protein
MYVPVLVMLFIFFHVIENEPIKKREKGGNESNELMVGLGNRDAMK